VNCPVGRGDKVTLQPIKATLEAIMALTDWQARGGEAQPGDFDAAFRRLLNDGGLEQWVADNEAGGGVDVLAAVAQGGNGMRRRARGVRAFKSLARFGGKTARVTSSAHRQN